MANDADEEEATLAKPGTMLCSNGQMEAQVYATAQLRDMAEHPVQDIARVQVTAPVSRVIIAGAATAQPPPLPGVATEALPPALTTAPASVKPPPFPPFPTPAAAPKPLEAMGAPLVEATSSAPKPPEANPSDAAAASPWVTSRPTTNAPPATVAPAMPASGSRRPLAAAMIATAVLLSLAGARFGLRLGAGSAGDDWPVAAAPPHPLRRLPRWRRRRWPPLLQISWHLPRGRWPRARPLPRQPPPALPTARPRRP